MTCFKLARRLAGAVALCAITTAASAAEVNVYSSRHYDSDDALYAEFTNRTGIEVNRIEGKADELIARLTAEGPNSPADVLITVDIGRMGRAKKAGILQPIASDIVTAAVPSYLRDPENTWFGISQRARIIFYAKDRVATPPRSYEALADDTWKGQICIRSSSNIYNQSLLASMIEALGEEAAKDWAAGVVANMARDPQGGDTDQLRGLVSGECDIAVANHYYFLRGFDSDVDGLTSGIEGLGWVWPNQNDRGAHLNLAAAAMTASSKNTTEAQAFLEFLTTEFAQQHFANQNNEYPTVPGVGLDVDTARLGFFIPDTSTSTASFGDNAGAAQAIFNQVGWK